MQKRIFDIIFSFLVLFLFLPVLILVGIIIKLDSKGPVLFKQIRIGKMGKPFLIYKFRTMIANNEAGLGLFEPGNMDRITRIGKVLRKTKIDEFPQFFNVLIGDMSIVGPRPEVSRWIEAYPVRYRKILQEVKPGLTDEASIFFRNEEEVLSRSLNPTETYMSIILPKKLDFYERYIISNSLKSDIDIILRTVISILKN